MATHSSILAWVIPWTDEPGGIQSMGSQRVGHDWATATVLVAGLLSVVLIMLKYAPSMGFPDSSVGKESACNAGDMALIPESGRSPGEENGYPLQYSCLENSKDRGAWRATVHGIKKSWTKLSNWECMCVRYCTNYFLRIIASTLHNFWGHHLSPLKRETGFQRA